MYDHDGDQPYKFPMFRAVSFHFAWNLLDLCFSLRVVKCFPFLLPVLMFQAIKPETSLADKPN